MDLCIILPQLAVRFLKIELTPRYLARQTSGFSLNEADSRIPKPTLASPMQNHPAANFALQADQRFGAIRHVCCIDRPNSLNRSQNDPPDIWKSGGYVAQVNGITSCALWCYDFQPTEGLA
jgi:hypothetical protein